MPHRFEGRLRRLEQQAPETAWLHSEGLAALLAAAKQSPRQSGDLAPEDLDDDGPSSGLRRLLAEARQSRQSMVLGS
jgi:signal transduction histidine kinase